MAPAETAYEQTCTGTDSYVDPDNGDCLPCEVVGYFIDGDECTPCIAGWYKPNTGPGSCTTCPTGTSSEPGSDEETDCKCKTGHRAESDGVACSPCGAGTYKDVVGAFACKGCPLKTSSVSGSNGEQCTACEVGTYKSVTGSGECSTCPDGTSSIAGTTVVTGCTCLGGYVGSAGTVCTICPENTYCVGGVLTDCPSNGVSEPGSDKLADCVCREGYFRPV
ncbi:hypothetical protein T484DRAFT_1640410 [Baffinella frigidus]|nr:hypothetical protein T484DRAFT_1640410 [Cryptophyta sp. CCMP2293]